VQAVQHQVRLTLQYVTVPYRRVCEANFVIVLYLLPFVWRGWGFSPSSRIKMFG
jgi:hypothetical protein